MVHSDDALAAKAQYMQYYTFMQRYKQYHQPYGAAASEEVIEQPEQPEQPAAEPVQKRAVDELFTQMNAEDQQAMASEAAKRQRVESVPSLDEDALFAAAMNALVESTSDDDALSTGSSDVSGPSHKAPLDAAAIADYKAAVFKTVRDGEKPMDRLEAAILKATGVAENDHDHPEDIRLAAREAVVSQHTCRMDLMKVSEAVRVACDSGYHTGENGETYEAVRNDWCHVTFDDGPFRVELQDGGCVLRLARTNKEGTPDYKQDIAKHAPDLAALLRRYHGIATALVPAGEDAAPVICVTDGKQQARIGGMLATPDEAARCGYNDGQLTTRRKSWQKKYKVKDSAKPRHVLRQIRDGTPAERADADRRRNSSNRSYGTGSTAQGAAAARAVSK